LRLMAGTRKMMRQRLLDYATVSFCQSMSYEPSFSKRPGGAAARPRFFSLLGLGSDTGDSGAPALKVIIDEESNLPSSRDADSAVSLLRALDSAGDQSVARDSSFPPKPHTPTKKQQSVSPVAQKFGRRAAVESKSKGMFCFSTHLLSLLYHFISHFASCSALAIQVKFDQRAAHKHFFKPARSSNSSQKFFSVSKAFNIKASFSAACYDLPLTFAARSIAPTAAGIQ